MTKTEDLPEIRRAIQPLISLAVEVRPDWARDDIQGAIVAAAMAGWEWPRVLVEVARLMADPGGRPRDLAEASRDVRKHHVPPPAERVEQAKEAALDEYVRDADWYRRAHADEPGGDS